MSLVDAKALTKNEPSAAAASRRDGLYEDAATVFGAALSRLARAYEADPDKRRDLLQEIHVALWRSFGRFDGRCSLRTWVYRVAHNTATSQIIRHRARAPVLVSLAELDTAATEEKDDAEALDQRRALDRMLALIQKLEPLDREVILLYLEGMDAASIGEITGLSPGNVATKVHRIKSVLKRRFSVGGRRAE